MAIYLLKGIVIGLVCGMPVGAAGAMTIQRTFKFGRKQGLYTGLGASAADCIFAGAAAFGLTFLSDLLSLHKTFVSVAGGLIVLVMGLSMFRKKETVFRHGDGFVHFISAFTVGITNPFAMIAFLLGFSYMGIQSEDGIWLSVLAVAGVFIGTYAWWCAIAHATYLIKKKSRQDILDKINIVLSCVLAGLGIAMIVKGVLSAGQ